MNKKIFIILILYSFASCQHSNVIPNSNIIPKEYGYSQSKDSIFIGRAVFDTTSFKSNNYREALPSILKSKNKIEIRFIAFPSFKHAFHYTVLTYNKQWAAKHYYYSFSKDSVLLRSINKGINIDTLFSKLVSNNIFQLPDQDSILTGALDTYFYNPTTDELSGEHSGSIFRIGNSSDGEDDGYFDGCYWIEFKVGNNFRRYHYCNTGDYADLYPMINEFRSFSKIENIFNELTK
jgi:hypothetical protein